MVYDVGRSTTGLGRFKSAGSRRRQCLETLVYSCTYGIVLYTDCYHTGLKQASSKGIEKL